MTRAPHPDIELANGRIKIAADLNVLSKRALNERYVVSLYEEKACGKCPELSNRHCSMCDQCPAFTGRYTFIGKEKIKGRDYLTLPLADYRTVHRALDKGGHLEDHEIVDNLSRPKMVNKIKFTGKLFGENAVDEDGNPRANQEELVAKWLAEGRGIIQASPRTGKTVMATNIVCKLGLRTLIMASKIELLQQFRDTFLGAEGRKGVTNAAALEGKSKNRVKVKGRRGGVLPGTVHLVKNLAELEATKADIVLINPQKAITKENRKRFEKVVAGKFGICVVDEVHGANADVYARIISLVKPAHALGLTATPKRKDGRDKLAAFTVGPVVAVSRVVTLAPEVRPVIVKTLPPTNYKLWAKAVGWISRDASRNDEIVNAIFRDLKAGHRSIIVPVMYKDHMRELITRVNKRAIEEGYHRDLAIDLWQGSDRPAALARANNPKRRTVLVAIYSIIREGVDLALPTVVHCAVPMSATSTVGAPMFRQLGFRCATPMKGKKQPIIYVWIDQHITMFASAIRSLFWHEIVPGIKESLYKVDKDSFDRFASAPTASRRTQGSRVRRSGPARQGLW